MAEPTISFRLLETLTSALYEDPIILFREYVQNSLDAYNNEVNNDKAKVMDDLKNAGADFTPWKGGSGNWIQCNFKGGIIAYLQPRYRWFNCQNEKEETIGSKLKTYDEWVRSCRANIIKEIKD